MRCPNRSQGFIQAFDSLSGGLCAYDIGGGVASIVGVVLEGEQGNNSGSSLGRGCGLEGGSTSSNQLQVICQTSQ
jgi:hypothetical protein